MNAPSLPAQLRRRVGAAITDGFFLGLANGVGALPVARPSLWNLEVERDVPYRDGGSADHTLDVYRPRNTRQKLPVVLYLHGGGFRFLSKDTHWVFGLTYARQGYLVVNANYRLSPKHPYPAAVEDACAALTWLVANADRLGADLSRLVIAGESAGANLTAVLNIATAVRRPEPWFEEVFALGVQPKAAVAACGLFDVSHPERFSHHNAYLRDRLEEVTDAYLAGATAELTGADPAVWLEGLAQTERPLPPMFLPCGTWDVLLDDSRRLHAALQRLGSTRSKLTEYPRGPHAFHALMVTPSAWRCWRDTFAFLDAQL